VRVSLKAVPGVDSVDVSLEKGLAVVKMKAGNTTTLKQLNEAIAKNGFTMKDSSAVVVGAVTVTNGVPTLTVSGSNDQLQLAPQSASAPSASTMIGKTVVVEGNIPEAGKGKTPDSVHYKTMTEEKSK
jgi:3-hydroxyisobutyrate dehydrogenase-like beta-hydroxyacid dehydrogenase